MNTNKPELEEFMVFVDKNGAMGVIIKNTYTDSDTYPWWKCYKDKTYGQVFNEQEKHYDNIDKLYKVKYNYYNEYFYALKFMNNGDLDSYNCVYKYKEEIEEIQPLNLTINITINNHKNAEEIANEIKAVLEKHKFTNPCFIKV